MSLLPDLDDSGQLKCERPRAHIPTTGRNVSYLNWDNLLQNRCPSCGEYFPQSEGDRECKNHSGQSFKVPGFRFQQITKDLREKEEFKFPKF